MVRKLFDEWVEHLKMQCVARISDVPRDAICGIDMQSALLMINAFSGYVNTKQSNTIQRYTHTYSPLGGHSDWGKDMYPHNKGAYVKYSDHIKKVEQYRAEVEAAQLCCKCGYRI